MESLLVLEIIVEIEIDGWPIFIFSRLPPKYTFVMSIYNFCMVEMPLGRN